MTDEEIETFIADVVKPCLLKGASVLRAQGLVVSEKGLVLALVMLAGRLSGMLADDEKSKAAAWFIRNLRHDEDVVYDKNGGIREPG